jgi:phospholipid transport system substrate-binding protein
MRSISVVFALALAAPVAAAPAAEAGPVQTIERTVERALEVLRDPALKQDRNARHRRLRALAEEVFDWRDMARRSLGPYWRDLDEGQRRRFVDVFVDLLAQQYMDDLDRFQGDERVEILGGQDLGGAYEVKTLVVTHARDQVPIHYFLHREGDVWLIHDFSVEGVSLVSHYRKTFTRFLVNNDFEALMQRLERKQGGLPCRK